MLKLEGMVSNAYLSYLAHVNSLLSLACRHFEIGRYGQERLLIVLESCQYLLIPSLQVWLVEIGRYGQKRLLIVLGTSQYFLMGCYEN